LLGVLCWRGVGALDLSFDVDFPSFSGFDATITVNDQPCAIRVRVAPDAKGKYACIPDGCSINGVPVAASGSIKTSVGPEGAKRYFYTGTLKSLPGASEKVSIKATGELTSGIADFQYSGPKGKLKIAGHPIDILADLGLKIGTVSIDPALLATGKLGGSGSVAVGLGSDSGDTGPLKIKITPTSLSVTLKVGTRKVSFKAVLEGDLWKGTLKVTAKPVVFSGPYSIPATGLLRPPVRPGGGTRCPDRREDVEGTAPITGIEMLNDARSNAGNFGIHRAPSGNLYAFGSFAVGLNAHYYFEGCVAVDLDRAEPGRWFCIEVDRYDFQEQRTTDEGTLCFDIESADGVQRGRWAIDSRRGEHIQGTWSATTPLCGNAVGEPAVEAAILDAAGANQLGSISMAATARGKTSVSGTFNVMEKALRVYQPCSDADLNRSAAGEWFCVAVDEFVGAVDPPYRLFGSLCFELTGTFPYFEGRWTLRDLGGAEIASGAWRSSVPVCGPPEGPPALYADLLDPTDQFALGSLQIGASSKGSTIVDINLNVLEKTLLASHPCTDVDRNRSAAGDWFCVDIDDYAPELAPPNRRFGSICFEIADDFPFLEGRWSLRSAEGAELASGLWRSAVPACGPSTGEVVFPGSLFASKDVYAGSFEIFPAANGQHNAMLNLSLVDGFFQGSEYCLDVDPSPAGPGPWLSVAVFTFDLQGLKQPAGAVILEVDTLAPKLAGPWTLEGLDGAPRAAGRWRDARE
jgi:hypothetical protein